MRGRLVLIAHLIETTIGNHRYEQCPRIAQQVAHAIGLEIDKDLVRRLSANHPLQVWRQRSFVALLHSWSARQRAERRSISMRVVCRRL